MKKQIESVDVTCGQNLRAIRLGAGLSQAELGKRAGLTFQQIQKYENGTNRMSASRIAQLASLLNVSVISFFEGIDGGERASKMSVIMKDRTTFELVKNYNALNKDQRNCVRALVREMASK